MLSVENRPEITKGGGGLLFQMAYISGSNMLYMKNSIQVVYSALLKRVTFLILQNTTKLPMSNNPHEFFTSYRMLHEKRFEKDSRSRLKYSQLVTVDSRHPAASDVLPDSAMRNKPQKI